MTWFILKMYRVQQNCKNHVKTWYMENAVNKTLSQYKLMWRNIIHAVNVSSMNFLSEIQIYKTWIKVLTLQTQQNVNTKLL